MTEETDIEIKEIPETPKVPNYKKDIKSILLLFLLYILQGIPLGLMLTVPFLLLSRGVSYTEQAKFSLAFWPFSLKVLYAPIIDAVYIKRIGRRKSWLIPLQYLISIFLFTLSFTVDDLMSSRNVSALAGMFFVLNFLAASQDVAVDGWALTMLSPENVAYASTCNAAGQTLGFVMGYSVFMALDSTNFANKFRSVPMDRGLITLPQFLLFWAIVFAITTTLILIYKKEEKESAEVSQKFHMNIFESYKNLYKILKLRNIQILVVFLLTARIGFAGTDGLTKLKLVEYGVAKETIAFYSIPLIPFKLLLPILTAKWTTGPNPLKLYFNTIPFTLSFGIIYPLVVYLTPKFQHDGGYDLWYYFFLFGIVALELIPSYTRFIASMAFAAKISDPAVGGTYMTLINTVNNIGGTWPSTVALWLVDYLTIKIGPSKECQDLLENNSTILTHMDLQDFNINSTTNASIFLYESENITSTSSWKDKLIANDCQIRIDGYFIICGFCLIFGTVWLIWGSSVIRMLRKRPGTTWRVYNHQ